MSELAPVPLLPAPKHQSEPEPFTGFAELVRASQTEYRHLKKAPWRELSQGILLPEFATHSFTQAIFNGLPDYLPADLIQRLHATHPRPLIDTGVLIDKRAFLPMPGWKYDVPPEINSDDPRAVTAWANGMELLNEIATDTLAFEVLDRLSQDLRYHHYPWFRPLSLLMRGWRRQKPGYEKALNSLETLSFGTWEDLRQKLVISMFSGDTKDVSALLSYLGWGTLNQVASQLGQFDSYGPHTSATRDSQPPHPFTVRAVSSLFISGSITARFPGVINLPLLSTTLTTGLFSMAATISGVGLAHQPELPMALLLLSTNLYSFFNILRPMARFPHILTHEYLHYLSQDTNRTGLRRFILPRHQATLEVNHSVPN